MRSLMLGLTVAFGILTSTSAVLGAAAAAPAPATPATPSKTPAPPKAAADPNAPREENWHPLELAPIPPTPEPPHTAGKPAPLTVLPPDPPEPPSLARQSAIRRALAAQQEEQEARDAAARAALAAQQRQPAPALFASPQNPNVEDPTFVPGPLPFHGELVDVGIVRLVNAFSYASLGLGPAIYSTPASSSLFAAVDPQFALYLKNFSVAAHVPLNLDVLDINGLSVAYGGLKVRREDWLTPASYLKVLRFATYGHREDPIYVSLSSLQPLNLGHRMLLDRYQGNVDVNASNTSAVVDLSNRFAGFQAMMNDLTFTNRIIGGLVFMKPFFWLDILPLRSLSLGGEYVADLAAPRCVRFSSTNVQCVQGTGNVGGRNPYTETPLDQTFVRSDPTTGLFAVQKTTVHAAGASAEAKVYANPGGDDIKAYTTWHKFLNAGGGTGWALGVLGRFQVGDKWIHAFRSRAEYRTFTDGFLPSYFGTTYEADKFEYGYNQTTYQVTPTKYQAVFGDPDNGFARRNLGRRHGFKLEQQWALYRGSRGSKRVAVGIGLEDSSAPNDTAAYVHLEIPAFHALQLFGTYMHRNEANLAGLFKAQNFRTANTLILAGLRLRVLPIMWLSVQYSYSFQRARSPGSEYHLGNSTVVDPTGRFPSAPQAHLFEPVSTLAGQLEFGWDFGD